MYNKRQASNLFEYIPDSVIEETGRFLTDTTGISLGIMDYQGKLISIFLGNISCDLCRKRRIKSSISGICEKIDSFAALEASRRNSYFMYVCPYGLIDICAPIIIDGQYIGALFMGQIITDEKSMESLPHLNPITDTEWEKERHLQDVYQEEKEHMKMVSIEVLRSHAGLLEYCAKYLSEVGKNNKTIEQFHHLNESKKLLEFEKRDHISELRKLKSTISRMQKSPTFIMYALNSINQLAILENARNTYQSIQDLTQLTKYLTDQHNNSVTIEQELALLGCFLSLGKNLNPNVQIKQEFKIKDSSVHIPKTVLIHLVMNAYEHAFSKASINPQIFIHLYTDENNIEIIVRDNGIGISKSEASALMRYMLNPNMEAARMSTLYYMLQNLYTLYTDQFQFDINGVDNVGTTVTILLPVKEVPHD